MLTLHDAHHISNDWITKWNENHLDNYTSLFVEDAEEFSSLANRILRVSNGRLKGKNTLKVYWALLRNFYPDYHYEMKHVTVYQNDIVVHFTMKAFNTNCITKLSVNQQHKIEKTLLCHV